MSITRTIWDIECRPLPEDKLVKPVFEAPANYKNPELIAKSIAEQESKWRQTLALDATTCRVAMIGLLNQDNEEKILDGDERDILNDFWTYVINPRHTFVGFNIFSFDAPICIRRSYALGIRPPMAFLRSGRYWDDRFIDLMESWTLGNREQRISLDALCQHLGIPGKLKGEKPFNEMTDEDLRVHLSHDLKLTKAVADRLLYNTNERKVEG